LSTVGKRCGRCRGSGQHNPPGLGLPGPCEDCEGTGVKKPPKPKPRIKVDYEAPATLCRFEGRVPGRECYGAKTWHHIISRQQIVKRLTSGKWVDRELANYIADVLADPRLLVQACFGCHLGVIETANPAVRLTEDELPDGFFDAVAEYGLERDLPRHLRTEAA
jgi:hypothetical protein